MTSFNDRLKALRDDPRTAKAGMHWSQEESREFLALVKSGASLAQVANTFKRTEGAIESRLWSEIAKAVSAGSTPDDAATAFHVERSVVDKAVARASREKPTSASPSNEEPSGRGAAANMLKLRDIVTGCKDVDALNDLRDAVDSRIQALTITQKPSDARCLFKNVRA